MAGSSSRIAVQGTFQTRRIYSPKGPGHLRLAFCPGVGPEEMAGWRMLVRKGGDRQSAANLHVASVEERGRP